MTSRNLGAIMIQFISPPPDFSIYQQATGATLENSTGYYTITPEQFQNLQKLTFIVSSVCFFKSWT